MGLQVKDGREDDAAARRVFADKMLGVVVGFECGKVAKVLVAASCPFADVARLVSLLQMIEQYVVIQHIQPAKTTERVALPDVLGELRRPAPATVRVHKIQGQH
jgi:hypothetical protein